MTKKITAGMKKLNAKSAIFSSIMHIQIEKLIAK